MYFLWWCRTVLWLPWPCWNCCCFPNTALSRTRCLAFYCIGCSFCETLRFCLFEFLLLFSKGVSLSLNEGFLRRVTRSSYIFWSFGLDYQIQLRKRLLVWGRICCLFWVHINFLENRGGYWYLVFYAQSCTCCETVFLWLWRVFLVYFVVPSDEY